MMQSDATPYLNYFQTASWLLQGMINSELSYKPNRYYELLPYWELSQDITGPLKVLIAGEFKVGKSTFINALLKKTVLKSDIVPATAVITNICYGNDEEITVKLKDKSSWIYPMSELAALTSEGNMAYDNIRRNIEQVTIRLPNDFLQYLTIVDSPGINVVYDHHVAATENVFSQIDYVIWLMNVSQPAKKGEVDKIKQLPSYLKPVVVVNGMDNIDPEEDDPEKIISTVRDKVGSFAREVYGVSAKHALEGYENNNNKEIEDSGFSALEKVIRHDLCTNWYVHKYNAINGRMKNYRGIPFFENYLNNLKFYYPNSL
ncbi:MAG: dynamin family protein [Lachnospiraceae bacterium]|nr:dynamin family protein [Lachnospiraceae bacterium]